jgi:hypothetical protein
MQGAVQVTHTLKPHLTLPWEVKGDDHRIEEDPNIHDEELDRVIPTSLNGSEKIVVNPMCAVNMLLPGPFCLKIATGVTAGKELRSIQTSHKASTVSGKPGHAIGHY